MEQAVQVNPLAQEINVQVETKHVELKETSFSFRTTKVKDETGKEVDWKRPTYKKSLPFVTAAGVLAALAANDQKTTELIVDCVNSSVTDRARGIINDAIEVNPGLDLSDAAQFDLNLEELSIAKIANLPKSERGAGIPKEQWQAFVQDYIATMQTPEAVAMFADKKPRSQELLAKHGILLGGKFNQVKSRKDVVSQMLGFLDVWLQVTKNGEEHYACYDHLVNKGKAILQAESFDDL